MSIWSHIVEVISTLANGEGLSAVFDRLRNQARAPEKSVAFTIAAIALSAKMAKADGQVTRDEVSVFRKIFALPESEEKNAARVFNLARQDVAGFDAYARKIAAMFRKKDDILCNESRHVLIDLLEALFQIAAADGEFHPSEDAFLHEVAHIFGLDEKYYLMMRARMIDGTPRDPYNVLGVSYNASLEEIRSAWRNAVKESHPDRMIARGVPPEAVRLAERRLVAVNAAWEEISAQYAA